MLAGYISLCHQFSCHKVMNIHPTMPVARYILMTVNWKLTYAAPEIFHSSSSIIFVMLCQVSFLRRSSKVFVVILSQFVCCNLV